MIIPVRPFLLGLLVLVAVAVVGYGSYAYAEGRPPFGPSDDKWTGVFLTNGQAYFGHFYSTPGEFAMLREVYYVLATQLQPQDGQGTQTQLSVQRKGNEVYGPQPDMRISKSQILFIEELRPDSPLVQSIAQLKSQPAPAPGTQATATPRPATSIPTATPSPAPSRSPSPSPR